MFTRMRMLEFAPSEAPELVVATARLGGARLCAVSSTGHRVGLEEPEFSTVLVPRRGRIEVELAGGRRLSGGAGDLVVFSPNSRVTTVLPDRSGLYDCDCALIPRRPGEGEDPLAPKLEHVFRGARGSATGLRAYLDFLNAECRRPGTPLAEGSAQAAARALLDDLFLDLLDRAEAVAAPPEPGAIDARLVRRAEEIIEARLEDPITVADVAEALGVTARRLQYAFRRVRSESPRDTISRLRLERVRARLSRPETGSTVTRIALDCGFAHLGRFARAYAAAFGESPSETLRRARG